MRFFATCAKGTEGALRRELAPLRLHALRGERGGVSFEGKLEAGMKVCLHTRVAMRVLLELGSFPAEDAATLYDGTRALPWADWLTQRTTLAVEATVKDAPSLSHSGFAALKVKDAVVDALREKLGARPDVDPKDPDVRLVLHLAGGRATLSLDMAGEPLHKRGYRTAAGPAPLKESLAAAILSLGGVDPERPFLDPMCGSGTLAIEQALRARRIAPGLSRPMGFQRWPAYRGGPQSAWDRMKEAARAEIRTHAPAPIVARDLHPKAIAACRENLAAAGVAADVRLEQGDARDVEPSSFGDETGSLCTNPPYGERLMGGGEKGEKGPPTGDRREAANQRRKMEGLFRGLAEAVGRFHGWTAVILSGSPLLERAFPAKPEVFHRLWNGPLEVRLLKYRVK